MRNVVWMAASVVLGWAVTVAAAAGERPNVLFIAVDDLNDWVGCLGGHPDIETPNIDRLAARGLLFTNAHCAAPLCNPSRTATLSGMRPSTTGVYGNNQDWRQAPRLADVVTLPEYFRQHGYYTAGGGKVYHANHGGPEARLTGGHGGRRGFNHPASWVERYPSKDAQLPIPVVRPGQNFNGLDIWHWDWGPIDHPDAATQDGRMTDWAVEQLKRKHERPFFLAVGIYKPHGPWYAPRPYYERYPVDEVTLPVLKEDDLADIPEAGKRFARGGGYHELILKNNLYPSAVQAYLATITFADAMVGKVLDALDESPEADNTIIVLWSDHGWHLGEKTKWHKSTLWEEATRVPIVFVVPQMTKAGTECGRPASLMDLYPTLVELCGLPERNDLDGTSLVPLLVDPHAVREQPAITTVRYKNHAVRSEHWRYIRYEDGSEELYDHRDDPHEWTNLADAPKHQRVKAELAKWLPEDAEPAPRLPRERR